MKQQKWKKKKQKKVEEEDKKNACEVKTSHRFHRMKAEKKTDMVLEQNKKDTFCA